MSALLYLAGLLAAFVVGTAAGWFFTRNTIQDLDDWDDADLFGDPIPDERSTP